MSGEAKACALPGRAVGKNDRRPWDMTVLDIAECDRLEIVLPLKPGELAGIRPETWPEEVRALAFRGATDWVDGHRERAVRAISYGVADGVCVLVLHHAPKAAANVDTDGA